VWSGATGVWELECWEVVSTTFLPQALDFRVRALRSGSEVSSWSSIRGGGAEGLAPGVEVFCLLS